MFPDKMQQLISQLRVLPGVGPRSAQRMAIALLLKNKHACLTLSAALHDAATHITQCTQCRGLCEGALCDICQSPKRNRQLLCVVESPADVFAIEQSGQYNGLYYVLGGRLSPLDGVGPKELGLVSLANLVRELAISELILATSATVEGNATQFYIQQLLEGYSVKLTRLAQGMPSGGELDSIDNSTLSQALSQRLDVL